jgi:hypothetical protein
MASSIKKYVEKTKPARKLKLIKLQSDDEINLELIKKLNTWFNFHISTTQRAQTYEKQKSNDHENENESPNKYSSLPATKNATGNRLKYEKKTSRIDNFDDQIKIIQIDDEQLRFIYDLDDLKIEIFQNDLLDTISDVIVNAANGRLVLGSTDLKKIKFLFNINYQFRWSCWRN